MVRLFDGSYVKLMQKAFEGNQIEGFIICNQYSGTLALFKFGATVLEDGDSL